MEERDRLAAENERIAAELDRLVELLGSIAHEGDQARTAVCRLNEELRGAWLLHRPSELAGTGPLIATQMVIFPQPANSGASLDQELNGSQEVVDLIPIGFAAGFSNPYGFPAG